jgi:hypothetical protein
MKVLFLDVDGVLNNRSSLRVYQPRVLFELDGRLVDRLKEILEKSDCELVLSSAWRLIDGGREFLESSIGKKFLGETERFNGCRGEEIQHWLKSHPEVTTYAIVDDDGDMLESQLRNFFQTDPEYGLTDTMVYRITYHLNNGGRYNESTSVRR